MITEASARYLTESSVRTWLLNRSPVRSVDSIALGNSCVYSIGFGSRGAAGMREIEDVLIVCHTVGHFVCGVIAGLGQPHVFSKTPLMRGVKPVTRRFAIDLSRKNRLEFLEFVHFDNGATVVFLRHFMHTSDYTLPVVAEAVLYDTKGNILMKAYTSEVADCPGCERNADKCTCIQRQRLGVNPLKKNNYITLELTTNNWSQYVTSFFTNKSRRGTTHASMFACTPQGSEINVFNTKISTYTDILCGDTQQMRFIRRQALFALQVDACSSNPHVDHRITPVRPKLDLNAVARPTTTLFIPSPAILDAGERKALTVAGVTPPPPTPPVPSAITESISAHADFSAIADIVDSDTSSGWCTTGTGGSGDDNRPLERSPSIPVVPTIAKRPRGRQLEQKRRYECTTCGKCFAHTGHLSRHYNSVHLRIRKYKCDLCEVSFFQASHLKSHVKHVHLGEKPWQCEICGQRLCTENRLRTHLLNVHRMKPCFSCPEPKCQKQFVLKADVARHQRRVHHSLETR